MNKNPENVKKDLNGDSLYNYLVETYDKYQKAVILAGVVTIILLLLAMASSKVICYLLLVAGLVCTAIPAINYYREMNRYGVTTIDKNKIYSQIEKIAYGEKAVELHTSVSTETGTPAMVNREMPALAKATLAHVAGLNLPDGAKCKVVFRGNVLEIESMSQKIKLSGDKLVGAEIIKRKDISKQAVSSAGGAIAGLYLAGALGGALGGASHTKKVQSIQKFLAISYMADGEVKYIVFGADNDKAYNICRAISKYTKQKQVEVEL